MIHKIHRSNISNITTTLSTSIIVFLLSFSHILADPGGAQPANQPIDQSDIENLFSKNAVDLNLQTGNNFNIGTGPTFLTELISKLLPLSLIFAGLLLLIMLIRGGFTMLGNPTNPQNQDAGKQRITWALVGFFLLFCSYWLAEILGIVFNINIV